MCECTFLGLVVALGFLGLLRDEPGSDEAVSLFSLACLACLVLIVQRLRSAADRKNYLGVRGSMTEADRARAAREDASRAPSTRRVVVLAKKYWYFLALAFALVLASTLGYETPAQPPLQSCSGADTCNEISKMYAEADFTALDEHQRAPVLRIAMAHCKSGDVETVLDGATGWNYATFAYNGLAGLQETTCDEVNSVVAAWRRKTEASSSRGRFWYVEEDDRTTLRAIASACYCYSY